MRNLHLQVSYFYSRVLFPSKTHPLIAAVWDKLLLDGSLHCRWFHRIRSSSLGSSRFEWKQKNKNISGFICRISCTHFLFEHHVKNKETNKKVLLGQFVLILWFIFLWCFYWAVNPLHFIFMNKMSHVAEGSIMQASDCSAGIKTTFFCWFMGSVFGSLKFVLAFMSI